MHHINTFFLSMYQSAQIFFWIKCQGYILLSCIIQKTLRFIEFSLSLYFLEHHFDDTNTISVWPYCLMFKVKLPLIESSLIKGFKSYYSSYTGNGFCEFLWNTTGNPFFKHSCLRQRNEQRQSLQTKSNNLDVVHFFIIFFPFHKKLCV